MSYNPRSGNPFTQCDPNTEWTTNNLILQDHKLRERAGMTVLDHNVSEMFAACKEAQAGGAVGAPLHLHKFGSKEVVPYEGGQTGGMPNHYFLNNKKW